MKNTKSTLTKQGSTIILRGVIVIIGLAVLVVCLFVLPPWILLEMSAGEDFDYGAIFLGLYVPALPFFFALYQAMKLLGYIDKNKAFSHRSVSALKNVKYCAVIITTLFTIGMPYIFYVADRDDAPGVAAIGFVIIGASFVIATFSGVMQKLVQNAVDIKSEKDLTV